jgi:hypothetical protein
LNAIETFGMLTLSPLQNHLHWRQNPDSSNRSIERYHIEPPFGPFIASTADFRCGATWADRWTRVSRTSARTLQNGLLFAKK